MHTYAHTHTPTHTSCIRHLLKQGIDARSKHSRCTGRSIDGGRLHSMHFGFYLILHFPSPDWPAIHALHRICQNMKACSQTSFDTCTYIYAVRQCMYLRSDLCCVRYIHVHVHECISRNIKRIISSYMLNIIKHILMQHIVRIRRLHT